MLQVLRDSMKYLAWILWVVIGVFVLFVFVDFGRGNRYGGGSPTAAAATVAAVWVPPGPPVLPRPKSTKT